MKIATFFLIISLFFTYKCMAQEKYKVISWDEFHKLYPNIAKNKDYEVDIIDFNQSFLWELPDGNYFMQANHYLDDHLLIFDKDILLEIKKNEFVPFTREVDLLSVKYRDKVLAMEENYMFFIELLQQKLGTTLSLEYSEENLKTLFRKIMQKKLYKDSEVLFLATVYVCVIIKEKCKNMVWTSERSVIGLNYSLYPDLYSEKRGYRFDVAFQVYSKIKRKKYYDEEYFVRWINTIISKYNEAENK